MKKIQAAAIKTAKGVVSAKPPAHHPDVARKAKALGGSSKGERGFKLTDGQFVGRQEAKAVAKKSGQANVKGARGLHSGDVFKGEK